jgi:four helix bundle protein
MDKQELQRRTKRYALEVIRFVDGLPRTRVADIVGRQLLRCSTSVGANYRAACRAKSRADFLAKMKIVEEEADECLYWMEILLESETIKPEAVKQLYDEGNQIVAIIVSAIKNTRNS